MGSSLGPQQVEIYLHGHRFHLLPTSEWADWPLRPCPSVRFALVSACVGPEQACIWRKCGALDHFGSGCQGYADALWRNTTPKRRSFQRESQLVVVAWPMGAVHACVCAAWGTCLRQLLLLSAGRPCFFWGGACAVRLPLADTPGGQSGLLSAGGGRVPHPMCQRLRGPLRAMGCTEYWRCAPGVHVRTPVKMGSGQGRPRVGCPWAGPQWPTGQQLKGVLEGLTGAQRGPVA